MDFFFKKIYALKVNIITYHAALAPPFFSWDDYSCFLHFVIGYCYFSSHLY